MNLLLLSIKFNIHFRGFSNNRDERLCLTFYSVEARHNQVDKLPYLRKYNEIQNTISLDEYS